MRTIGQAFECELNIRCVALFDFLIATEQIFLIFNR